MASQIERPIGGKDASKEFEVVSDAMSKGRIGSGGEVDESASGLLLLDILEQFAVVRKVGDIELNGIGYMALESSFSFGQPTGKLENRGRMLARKGESGINERVGFDQSAVKIDAKCWKRGSAGSRNGHDYLYGCLQLTILRPLYLAKFSMQRLMRRKEMGIRLAQVH